jgi:hypothetical protein
VSIPEGEAVTGVVMAEEVARVMEGLNEILGA